MELPNTAYFVDGPKAGELIALQEAPPPFIRIAVMPAFDYSYDDIHAPITTEEIIYVRERRDFGNHAMRYVVKT